MSFRDPEWWNPRGRCLFGGIPGPFWDFAACLALTALWLGAWAFLAFR